MKLLALLLLPITAFAQSVPIPPLSAPLPAVVDMGWTLRCPIAGKTATCTLPQRTLLPASRTATTASSTALPTPITMTFSCTGPDMQHLTCTATVVK